MNNPLLVIFTTVFINLNACDVWANKSVANSLAWVYLYIYLSHCNLQSWWAVLGPVGYALAAAKPLANAAATASASPM